MKFQLTTSSLLLLLMTACGPKHEAGTELTSKNQKSQTLQKQQNSSDTKQKKFLLEKSLKDDDRFAKILKMNTDLEALIKKYEDTQDEAVLAEIMENIESVLWDMMEQACKDDPESCTTEIAEEDFEDFDIMVSTEVGFMVVDHAFLAQSEEQIKAMKDTLSQTSEKVAKYYEELVKAQQEAQSVDGKSNDLIYDEDILVDTSEQETSIDSIDAIEDENLEGSKYIEAVEVNEEGLKAIQEKIDESYQKVITTMETLHRAIENLDDDDKETLTDAVRPLYEEALKDYAKSLEDISVVQREDLQPEDAVTVVSIEDGALEDSEWIGDAEEGDPIQRVMKP